METVLDTFQTNITIYKYNTRVLKLFVGDQQGLKFFLKFSTVVNSTLQMSYLKFEH